MSVKCSQITWWNTETTAIAAIQIIVFWLICDMCVCVCVLIVKISGINLFIK